MSTDSNFSVYYKDGYACLTVYHSDSSSQVLYPEDVIGRLKILNIRGYKTSRIADIIDEASGEAVPVAKWPEGKKLSPEIKLITDIDGMTAKISVVPERQGGEPLSVPMLKNFLDENKIIYGIDSEILSSIVLKQIYNQEVKVAFGLPAVDEKPAEPEYTFLVDRGKPFKQLDYERIDLKELNFIQNKKEGELLARLSKPQPPADGKDIFGNTIPAARGVTPPEFSAGTGAVLSEDNKEITAAIDGNARLENGNVIVEPLISVENIDYSNGNIDFNGSVDISGRVADGFNVKARGDIQIGKSISRVNITSGGDIILKAGISGNDEGIIVCGGDLYARYIESANILCSGNIYVEEAIMHSSVKAGGDIILSGKRAEIFGGRIYASGSVRCKKLGSINEPVTELFLGLSLDQFTAMENLQNTVSKCTFRLNELEMQIRQLKNALKNASPAENHETSAEKLHSALNQLSHEAKTHNMKLGGTLRELHDLKRELTLNEQSGISAEQQIYGKVYIYFNHLRWESPGKGTGKTRLSVKQGKLLEK